MENIRTFYLKISIFLVVKFSVYLNRSVFVMQVGDNLHEMSNHIFMDNKNQF